ncbi:6-phosphogluconolactonase [Rhizohabitans arisaemae]|uniref:6-phosphogluconolactonase n=1 Tax=Rhizohabitans arisaemae TaxID=2720610 RepID=UPI0024B111A9|nr:6-phosphogluconolactonase [Rhizohabitans arisaemae]
MTAPSVVVHRDADLLAKATAARLITRILDLQAERGFASVVLTGGGVGIAVLAEVAASPLRDAVDWRRLAVWWGDERYLPSGDVERNETGARRALLDHVDLDPARVHAMPSTDSGLSPEDAAAAYAEELRQAAGPVPSFDVLMLGMGPDAHVASLFPGTPATHDQRPVVAVHDAPKPPPTRISLGFASIQAAQEVWIIAAGAEKAEAVRLALADSGPAQVPASGARGRRATRFLLDRAAAGELPPSFAESPAP